jgi:hypothetical protein
MVRPSAVSTGSLAIHTQPLPWEGTSISKLNNQLTSGGPITWTFPASITFPGGFGFFPMVERFFLYVRRIGTFTDAELLTATGGDVIVDQYAATQPHASQHAMVVFNTPNLTGLTVPVTFSSPVKVYAVRARLGVRV